MKPFWEIAVIVITVFVAPLITALFLRWVEFVFMVFGLLP